MVATDSLIAVVLLIWLAIGVLWLLTAWILGRLAVRKSTGNQRRRWQVTALVALAPAVAVVADLLWAQGDWLDRATMALRVRDADATLAQLCAARPALPRARAVIRGADGLDVVDSAPTLAIDGQHRDPRNADDLLQYATPLHWAVHASGDDLPRELGFPFIETEGVDSRGAMSVVATREWWQANGSRRTVRDDWKLIADEYPQSDWIQSAVRATTEAPSQASYQLTLTDISTREDRAHWVARARMRLVDRRDGHVVAEYVGFSANARPRVPHEGTGFDKQSWELTRECDGPEAKYGDGRSAWPALRFFFSEIVEVR